MQQLARQGYTRQQIVDALHASNRSLSFRYDLLDATNQYMGDVSEYVRAASVANNALADIIKRTARFEINDDGSIDYLSDRIKPFVRLKMPGAGYAEFAQGVFLLSTPPRALTSTGSVVRAVSAYDLLQVVKDDCVDTRYTVAAGTNYVVAVKALLDSAGVTAQNLTATTKTLPVARDWEPGTSKLAIINALLSALNYRSLTFDEHGTAVAAPYLSPTDAASEYLYVVDNKSVIFPEASELIDLFDVPNKWVLTVSDAERAVLTSTYTNANANSPTSTVRRGRTITRFETTDAADQATLDAKVARMAFESSQVFAKIEFETLIMPFHADADVYTVEIPDLGVSDKYAEHTWSFDLKAGARMKHLVRKVVTL